MTEKLTPPSLRKTATCTNCKHVFKMWDYDEEDEFYCQKIQKAPPLPHYLAMWGKDREPFVDYTANAEVHKDTVCDEHEPMTDGDSTDD